MPLQLFLQFIGLQCLPVQANSQTGACWNSEKSIVDSQAICYQVVNQERKSRETAFERYSGRGGGEMEGRHQPNPGLDGAGNDALHTTLRRHLDDLLRDV